jgi:apolipoprotein N-acyltransferase
VWSKEVLRRLVVPLFASLLSGALLFWAFPVYDRPLLAWFGLVPLVTIISGYKARYAFCWSLTAGIVFFLGVFNWMLAVPGYTLVHHSIIIPYLAFYFAAFGVIFCFVRGRLGLTTALLTAPCFWVCLEYIRSNIGFLSLPWALLGHSQYTVAPIIQFSAITGAYGVSFLIVLANVSLAMVILYFHKWSRASKSSFDSRFSKRVIGAVVLGTTVLIALSFLYGHEKLTGVAPSIQLRISVLQGNIDQEKKSASRKHSDFIMGRYRDLTEKAYRDKPNLIVWPEAATPGFLLSDARLKNRIRSLIEEVKAHFIIGSSELPKFMTDQRRAALSKGGNTALFFSPEGAVLAQYAKIRLVPFGEYIPYQREIIWPNFIVPENKRVSDVPGKEYTLFEIEGSRFGVIICWENVFPDLTREFVRRGAEFMLNITNEGWFGETAAPYQMVAISVFRAVENRIWMIRAANTGISCFIDPYGRITGRVRNNGKDIFTEGYLTQEIGLREGKTFYTLYGDLFVYLNCLVTVITIVLSFVRNKRGQPR